MTDQTLATPSVDPIGNILKWILLIVAIVCFAMLAWATILTYQDAPPIPGAFLDPSGATLMTEEDVVAGKAGFQKADLMDYGSIYGMGSYFGEDYTASTLVALGTDTREAVWVSLIVVAAALIGNYLGIQGIIDEGWFWIGNQGLSYIQLGRLWQICFFLALAAWSILMFRALWPSRSMILEATRQFWTGNIRLEHLIWAATVNVAILYMCGMIPLTGVGRSFTITDFWRWWVVHLWVEQSFEFFAVSISAYLLMALGLVSRKLAERSVYLELILIFVGGVLGTGHHLYWGGEPSMWVPLGTMFSFIEVLPLVLLILEGIQQHRLIKASKEFNYELAYTFILGSAFWNFVGAGVFGGGTLNAPLVNYYEHGTFLTLNHAHTSLFGAFGLLALGLIYFCLRYRAGPNAQFDERLGYWAFWLMNVGVVLWVVIHFFPIGWPQLDAVFEHGLAYARSQAFYDQTGFWQWMRLPGDVLFSLGALLMSWDFLAKLRRSPGSDPERVSVARATVAPGE